METSEFSKELILVGTFFVPGMDVAQPNVHKKKLNFYTLLVKKSNDSVIMLDKVLALKILCMDLVNVV